MLLFIRDQPCLAVLRCCENFVWKIEHQVSTVLSFSFFSCNHRRSQGGNGTIPPKFLAYFVILCFDRQCLERNAVARLNSKCLSPLKFWATTQLLVTTFTQTACISLASSHVPQYQTFHTALSYLMLNLPLTKSSQKRRNARHCRTPMKSNILILILRSKQYYRVVIVLTVYTRRLHLRSCQTKLWSYASGAVSQILS